MPNANNTLPENLKQMYQHLSTAQAMPLGELSGLPFLAVKLPESHMDLLTQSITAELKPSVINVDFGDDTVALCFVQIRLNGADELTYTGFYDLGDDRQYRDAYALLAMQRYGLLVASGTEHEFLAFDVNFTGDFNPQEILAAARAKMEEHKPDIAHGIAQALVQQAPTPARMWEILDTMAPFDKQWYGHMRMEKGEKQ